MEQEVEHKLVFSACWINRFSLIDIGSRCCKVTFASGALLATRSACATLAHSLLNDIMILEGRDTIGPDGDIRIVNAASIRLENVGDNYAELSQPQPTKPKARATTKRISGSGVDDTGAQQVIADSYRTMFQSAFDRADRRRRNRRARILRAGAKPDDDIDTAMQVFVDGQQDFIRDTLRPVCRSFDDAFNVESFAVACHLGRSVLNGEIDPDVAALDLMAQFPRKKK